MKIRNVEIARIVSIKLLAKNIICDFTEVLDSIDEGRTLEQEDMEISIEELYDLIDNVCFSFITKE